MVNWNICEDPYPGPDEWNWADIANIFNADYIRMAGKRLLGQTVDEIEKYFTASPPTVSWSSASADPLKDLRAAMANFGKPAVVVGESMKEALDAFKDIPVTPLRMNIDMPIYTTADGKPKQRTRAPRADFGFDRRGRKIR